MQRNCKKVLKLRRISFMAAFFKNESVKARERKIQQSKQQFRI